MKSVSAKKRPCPRCGSTQTTRLLHASDIGTTNHYRCNSCGNMWSEPKPSGKSPRRTGWR